MNRLRRIIHAEEAYQKGYTGRGVTAAVLDSGAHPHPDYRDRVLCFRDLIGGREELYDDFSHGTHVTGILAGNGHMSGGTYRGIAPECSLVCMKILNRSGSGSVQDLTAAIQWVIDNRRKYGIRVMNISLGLSEPKIDQEDGRINKWCEYAWDEGIVVIAAAGNDGPAKYTITDPGTERKIITAGFYDVLRADGKMYYSGRGPTRDCICKPDITIPGEGIVSCFGAPAVKTAYTKKGGSSMAAAVISGACCLLLEKEPELDNVAVKMRLKECADDHGKPHAEQGWGRVNVKKLLRI